MEEIKYSYNTSGVKTLRLTGILIVVTGVISGLVIAFGTEVTTTSVISGFILIVSSFVTMGVCNALATIAENALLKTSLMKHKIQKEGLVFIEEIPVAKTSAPNEKEKTGEA